MKTDFNIKMTSQGQAFPVTGKPIWHFMMLLNNTGFNCNGSEDMLTEIAINSQF